MVAMKILLQLMKQCAPGIKGIFTAHGGTLEKLYLNKYLKKLLENGIFEKIIFLKPEGKRGEIEKVYLLNKDKYVLENK